MILAVGIFTQPAVCKIHRSAEARREFMREHPCPSTGLTHGRCVGFIVDHINPLACGGKDSPKNMQWQTIAAAREKDRWELHCTGHP